MVVGHHHLLSTVQRVKDEVGQERIDVIPGIADAQEMLETLATYRIRLYVHGHLGRPYVLQVQPTEAWNVQICGAGSTADDTALDKRFPRNHFGVYDIVDGAVTGRIIPFDDALLRESPSHQFKIADPVPDRLSDSTGAAWGYSNLEESDFGA
jgi:hypothetical protein